jgi:hypothetical protein
LTQVKASPRQRSALFCGLWCGLLVHPCTALAQGFQGLIAESLIAERLR